MLHKFVHLLSYLCLRERGTAMAFSGGNLSLFLDSSSLDMETYCESWELFRVLAPIGKVSLELPSMLLALER